MKAIAGFACLCLLLSRAPATQAKESKEKEKPAPPAQEIVQGVIYDVATGKPLPGATLAVRTRGGGVIAWGKTDDEGIYQLDGRYIAQVKLPAYKEKNSSILGQISRGANTVLSFAARSANALVKPVARAAASAVGGPVAGAVAGEVAGVVMPRAEEAPLELPDANAPGVFTVKVVCPDYRDYSGTVQAYWMEPPAPEEKERVLTFWLDHIGLAPRKGDKKLRSGPRGDAMRLQDALLEPSIAPRGTTVTIAVRLQVPEVAYNCVKLLARHDKSGTMTTLEPVRSQPGLFRGKMKVGAEWSLSDQQIVLLALRRTPASPEGPRSAPPEELADRLSLWKSRSLAFDPQILASRDREKLTLTVVQ